MQYKANGPLDLFFYAVNYSILFKVDNYWTNESTMNNLNDVYQHHCGGPPLKKATRDVFVKGSMADVREMFQVSFFIPYSLCYCLYPFAELTKFLPGHWRAIACIYFMQQDYSL